MKLLRGGVAWILYFLGDLISKIMHTEYTAFLYSVYNTLMITSADVQGEQNRFGPWN